MSAKDTGTDTGDKPKRVGTCLEALACSAPIPLVAICVGFAVTPQKHYQEVMGFLIPLEIYGYTGSVAAAMSFCATFVIFRLPRIGPLTWMPGIFMGLAIAAWMCVGAVYCGLKTMLQIPPAIY